MGRTRGAAGRPVRRPGPGSGRWRSLGADPPQYADDPGATRTAGAAWDRAADVREGVTADAPGRVQAADGRGPAAGRRVRGVPLLPAPGAGDRYRLLPVRPADLPEMHGERLGGLPLSGLRQRGQPAGAAGDHAVRRQAGRRRRAGHQGPARTQPGGLPAGRLRAGAVAGRGPLAVQRRPADHRLPVRRGGRAGPVVPAADRDLPARRAVAHRHQHGDALGDRSLAGGGARPDPLPGRLPAVRPGRQCVRLPAGRMAS